MHTIEELSRLTPDRDMVLTIGVFDGVHLGHRHLIQSVTKAAAELGCLSGVITFHPHPKLVLSPSFRPRYLTTVRDRLELIEELGVDIITTLTFTPELAQMTAEEFVVLVQQHLRMRALFIGWDFALGRGREGNEEALRQIGLRRGFQVYSVPRLVLGGEPVSSTAIRLALAEGDVTRAAKFLGRRFTLKGKVVHGAERGRSIGFPTANLGVDPEQALPRDGVYVTRAVVRSRIHEAVTNIGRRPSFDHGDRSVEVHLLGFEGNLYGEEISIELLQHLRGEKKFANIDELKAQINQDIALARTILGKND